MKFLKTHKRLSRQAKKKILDELYIIITRISLSYNCGRKGEKKLSHL